MERSALKTIQTLSVERFKSLTSTSKLRLGKYTNPKTNSEVTVGRDDSGVVICYVSSKYDNTKPSQVTHVEATTEEGRSQFWLLNNILEMEDLGIEL